jgi:hypothetical protein
VLLVNDAACWKLLSGMIMLPGAAEQVAGIAGSRWY